MSDGALSMARSPNAVHLHVLPNVFSRKRMQRYIKKVGQPKSLPTILYQFIQLIRCQSSDSLWCPYHFITTLSALSPILTMAIEPGCMLVAIIAMLFWLMVEPTCLPSMVYMLTLVLSSTPCTLMVPPSLCISTALAELLATLIFVSIATILLKFFHGSAALYASIDADGT